MKKYTQGSLGLIKEYDLLAAKKKKYKISF
jgi:hypothetical protein